MAGKDNIVLNVRELKRLKIVQKGIVGPVHIRAGIWPMDMFAVLPCFSFGSGEPPVECGNGNTQVGRHLFWR